MGFDKIFDLTAGVYLFLFLEYFINVPLRGLVSVLASPQQAVFSCPQWIDRSFLCALYCG